MLIFVFSCGFLKGFAFFGKIWAFLHDFEYFLHIFCVLICDAQSFASAIFVASFISVQCLDEKAKSWVALVPAPNPRVQKPSRCRSSRRLLEAMRGKIRHLFETICS